MDLREERPDNVQRGFQDGRRQEGDVETWYSTVAGVNDDRPGDQPERLPGACFSLKALRAEARRRSEVAATLPAVKLDQIIKLKIAAPWDTGQWKIRPS